jgi:transposase-like protein
MAHNEGAVVSENQRWTGKRKAEAVLDIIKGKVSLVDFCRANDLKQTDVEKWMDDFVKSGTQGLKSNAKDRLSEQDKQIAELQQVIGEQALHIRVLKKASSWPNGTRTSPDDQGGTGKRRHSHFGQKAVRLA